MKTFFSSEAFRWWLPMLLLCLAAGAVRTVNSAYNLPASAGTGTDEWYYYVWATAIRETGRPNVEHGTGYPPGFLYLLAGEQIVTRAVRGEHLNPAVDHIALGRFVNGLFGTANVLILAMLGRWVGKSRLAGLAAGLIAATSDVMIEESRMAWAEAPWLFFTLLAFLFLFRARDKDSTLFLYMALLSGAVSFLFKYQSGVFPTLPFIYAVWYFRAFQRRRFLHFGIWAIALLVLLVWLILDYKVFEIVNTPFSDTGSVIENGRLVGLQSLQANIRVLASASGSMIYAFGAIASLLFAVLASSIKQFDDLIDRGAVFTYWIFATLFYFLMSFFQPTDIDKWVTLAAVTYLLTAAAVVASLRVFVILLVPQFRLAQYLSLAALIAVGAVFANNSAQKWYRVYREVWTKPYTLNLLDEWFKEHVPQGGRVVSEDVKVLYNYSHSPGNMHVHTLPSVFQETVESYRAQGYEYLIWNDMYGESTEDVGAYLRGKEGLARMQGAEEVLRLAGEEMSGPDIVVFQLKPIQQHPLFAWFTPAISFRGYDLNSEIFKAGDTLELMLYWMSAERTTANYIVFVHLLFDDGKTLLAGQDGPPDYGNRPTWKWEGDMQFIRDQRLLSIPADAPPGKYILRMGMYDADTKLRAQITGPQGQPFGDTLILQKIEIEK